MKAKAEVIKDMHLNDQAPSDLTRRNLFKLTLATGVVGLTTQVNSLALAEDEPITGPIVYPPSPPVLAWRESIPAYVIQPKKL